MKLWVVLMHIDGGSDPSDLIGVTAGGIEAAMDLALATENMYEEDKAKWDSLDWEDAQGQFTAHTNSSMGEYEIVETELPYDEDCGDADCIHPGCISADNNRYGGRAGEDRT